MIRSAAIDLVRSSLRRFMDWLDRLEERTPRAQQNPLLMKEFHIPPLLIGAVSTLLLYLALFFSDRPSWPSAIALSIFVGAFVVLFSIYMRREHPQLAKSDDALALLAVIFFSTLLFIMLIANFEKEYWISPYLTPVAIAPLLTALLLHGRLAMVLAFVMAMLAGIFNHFSLPVALVGTLGGVTMVATISKARTSHDVWRAGLFTGIVQVLILFFLAVSLKTQTKIVAIDYASAFLSGLFAAFFGLGARPLLESFFSRASNLRLLELSDVNHPLLRQMSLEAPGTFHHSLIVATLAEDAANAVGANGLLCRVGAYFHDIGKMVKAEYFIENQGTFGNPHDQVAPSLSKLVITSHVKEGLALAKSHKIDQQVSDFIPQHHGTSKIEYFYHKALKLERHEDEDEVDEETYRYPGPKPQTREAGIVMMADSVEAASRSLEEASHQRYKDLVYKIINKKFFDSQLDETSLTLRDLHIIAERFTATLTSLHHARVPYPEALAAAKKSQDELTPPE